MRPLPLRLLRTLAFVGLALAYAVESRAAFSPVSFFSDTWVESQGPDAGATMFVVRALFEIDPTDYGSNVHDFEGTWMCFQTNLQGSPLFAPPPPAALLQSAVDVCRDGNLIINYCNHQLAGRIGLRFGGCASRVTPDSNEAKCLADTQAQFAGVAFKARLATQAEINAHQCTTQSALDVTLGPGVSNGQVFSVEVNVKNTTPGPLTQVAFTQPNGVIYAADGPIALLIPPNPPLPTHLAPGESVSSTVTFAAAKPGSVDVLSEVKALDGDGVEQKDVAQGLVEIGRRRLTEDEVKRVMADALIDASRESGARMNRALNRLGDITAWAAGPNGADTIPPWLDVPVDVKPLMPVGVAVADPPGWKISAARSLGLDDRALAWLPDEPALALEAYLEYSHRYALAGGKVIDDTANGALGGLKECGTFYSQLAAGNDAYRAAAERELNGLVDDIGVTGLDTLKLLSEISVLAQEDPLGADPDYYEHSPALRAFNEKTAELVSAGVHAFGDKTAQLVRKAKVDPVGAAGDLGDINGTLTTTLARDVVLTEIGLGGVSKFTKVVEATMPFARTGERLESGLAALDPAAEVLVGTTEGTGGVVVRQSLESLGDNAVITVEQLEALGGFYGEDAAAVQKIIADINAKYGVEIEIQCRPGNPASLEFYRNGTGVPKPEWIKPKNTEWMDVVLGAPQDSLGKATVYKPVAPTPETLSKFTQAQQQTILSRYNTQLELYEDATSANGKFAKLIKDSQSPEGATVHVGFGTGAKDISGLRYSLRPVGEPGQEAFVVIDEAAGGKFVLSDADYQAVIDASTGRHLPASVRGQIEREVMERFQKDTASFGGHGWSHSGFDLKSEYSKPFIQFVTEYTSPEAGRRTLAWFVGKGDPPKWLKTITDDLAAELGATPTQEQIVDKLLDKFRPGNFVVKFNGQNIRTGYGAGIR